MSDDEDENFLGSIGFMFDAQHVRLTKTVCFGDNISLQLKLIGEDPGHVQSGQYLWPAAAFMGHYLLDNWEFLKSPTILELGAGVGLAGLVAAKLPGSVKVVLTDYDHGSLQLLKENIDLNATKEDSCEVTVEFLEWGKTLNTSSHQIQARSSSHSSNHESVSDVGASLSSSSGSTETYSLLIGTDLLYCTEIVVPLFTSVKLLLGNSETSRFVLVSSFNPGNDIESAINKCCHEIGLSRRELLELNEEQKICRVEYFEHLMQSS